jgi:outer membrane protein assembly factor BamB
LFCYDFSGKEIWRKDLGKQVHEWGYGSSPVIYKDLCILNFGPGPRSFLIAVEKKTGKTVWQVDTPEAQPATRTDGFAGRKDGYIGSWSTPIVIKSDGRDELIMTSPEVIRAYAPATGKELWSCGGMNPLLYTSPIAGEGVVVGMGGFMGTTVAVKAGGAGDRTKERLWETVRTKNRMGSGVIYDGMVFVPNTPGVAECIDLKTGKVIWEERLRAPGPKSETWSSMVLVGDRIYVVNQSGDTIVLRASPKFEVISVNSIGGELTNASLAVSDGDIFLRSHQNLWCFSEKGKKI